MMDLAVGIKSSALLEMVKEYLKNNKDHQMISKVTTRIRHRLGMVNDLRPINLIRNQMK